MQRTTGTQLPQPPREHPHMVKAGPDMTAAQQHGARILTHRTAKMHPALADE